MRYFCLFVAGLLTAMLIAGVTVLATGCASTAENVSYTPEQKLSLAYTVNTGLRSAASSALHANLLNVDKAFNVLRVTDATRAILDEAQLDKSNGIDFSAAQWVVIFKMDDEARQALRSEMLNHESH